MPLVPEAPAPPVKVQELPAPHGEQVCCLLLLFPEEAMEAKDMCAWIPPGTSIRHVPKVSKHRELIIIPSIL